MCLGCLQVCLGCAGPRCACSHNPVLPASKHITAVCLHEGQVSHQWSLITSAGVATDLLRVIGGLEGAHASAGAARLLFVLGSLVCFTSCSSCLTASAYVPCAGRFP